MSNDLSHADDAIGAPISSQQVNWWSVHQWVLPKLAKAGTWPTAGTPEWCALDDKDPRKWAALLDAGQHWALRMETMQQALCELSRDVSAAEDWSTIAQDIRARNELYTEKPWLKRVAS